MSASKASVMMKGLQPFMAAALGGDRWELFPTGG